MPRDFGVKLDASDDEFEASKVPWAVHLFDGKTGNERATRTKTPTRPPNDCSRNESMLLFNLPECGSKESNCHVEGFLSRRCCGGPHRPKMPLAILAIRVGRYAGVSQFRHIRFAFAA